MPVYKIVRKETSTQYALIDANSESEALECAQNKSPYWRENQDYQSEILSTEIAHKSELKGRLIDRAEGGTYDYPKLEKQKG
jgi:hypothetical protein